MWNSSKKCIQYINHVGSSHDCNSFIRSGLMAGGKDTREGGHKRYSSHVSAAFLLCSLFRKMDDDAATLLARTHAALVRELSEIAGHHFEGLQAAAHHKSLNLTKRHTRQLCSLDSCSCDTWRPSSRYLRSVSSPDCVIRTCGGHVIALLGCNRLEDS